MIRTRMNLLPHEIAGRMARSFDARGYSHALYLNRCHARLRQPITNAVGWTMYQFIPSRRNHPAWSRSRQ